MISMFPKQGEVKWRNNRTGVSNYFTLMPNSKLISVWGLHILVCDRACPTIFFTRMLLRPLFTHPGLASTLSNLWTGPKRQNYLTGRGPLLGFESFEHVIKQTPEDSTPQNER